MHAPQHAKSQRSPPGPLTAAVLHPRACAILELDSVVSARAVPRKPNAVPSPVCVRHTPSVSLPGGATPVRLPHMALIHFPNLAPASASQNLSHIWNWLQENLENTVLPFPALVAKESCDRGSRSVWNEPFVQLPQITLPQGCCELVSSKLCFKEP